MYVANIRRTFRQWSRTELLPPDRAAYAIQLGFCLAQHFPTVEALMASSAFIIILARETDDPVAIVDALYEIAAHEGARIAVNPTRNLENDDRLVVLADVWAEFSRGCTRAASEAARRGVPLICVTSSAARLPDALKGPDFSLELPAGVDIATGRSPRAHCHVQVDNHAVGSGE